MLCRQPSILEFQVYKTLQLKRHSFSPSKTSYEAKVKAACCRRFYLKFKDAEVGRVGQKFSCSLSICQHKCNKRQQDCNQLTLVFALLKECLMSFGQNLPIYREVIAT